MAEACLSHAVTLLLLTSTLCLSQAQQLTPTSTQRVTLRGQGDGSRSWTSSFVSGNSPGTSGSFQTAININGQTPSLNAGRLLDPLTNRWRFSAGTTLPRPPSPPPSSPSRSPPAVSLRNFRVPPSSSSSSRRSFLIPSFQARPQMTSRQIFSYRLPPVSEYLLQVMRSVRTGAASSQASGSSDVAGSTAGRQRAGTATLTPGLRGQGRASATLTPGQRTTSGGGTALTSSQTMQGARTALTPGQRTGSALPVSGQRPSLTLSSQQRPVGPSSRGNLGQRAGRTSLPGQTSTTNLATRTASVPQQQTQRIIPARILLPAEIRAQSASDLSNILQLLHQRAGTVSSPAVNVLQTAERVLNLLRNQARLASVESGGTPIQDSGAGSGSGNRGGTTQFSSSEQAASPSQSSSGSGGVTSPSGANKTTVGKESGASIPEAKSTISPSSLLLSQGVSVLTSTPQGVKVTVLNRSSKLIQDLLVGYSLDLATKKVIHSVLDPATSQPEVKTGTTFYMIHVDPLLNLLSLHPVSVNLTQMLQGTLQQRTFPSRTLEGLGTTGSGSDSNGLGRPTNSDPGTTQEPTTQSPPPKGPQASSDAFQFLLDFWTPSKSSAQGTSSESSDSTQSSSGLQNASDSGSAAGLGVTVPSSGTFQTPASSVGKEGDDEGMDGGGEGQATTTPSTLSSGTTEHPLLEPLWNSLITNGSTSLNITSENLNKVLDLLFNVSGNATTSTTQQLQPQKPAESSNSSSSSSSSSLLSSDVEVLRELTPDSTGAGVMFP